MKKLALALVAALPLAFASCGDDDKDVTLDQTSLTLNYDASATLTASEKGCSWTSSDPFVATVDQNGNVTAEHVGTAVIIATKDGNSARCNVTVNATNNNFTFPVRAWGNTVAQVKAAVSDAYTLNVEDDETLVYSTKNNSTGYPFYTYLFDENSLWASQLTVTADMNNTKDLEGWIAQYFDLAGYDNELEGDVYYNAAGAAEATEAALYYEDEDGDYNVMFMDVDDTKAFGYTFKDAVEKSKAAVKAAKKL